MRGTAVTHQEQLIPHDHVLRYRFHERLIHWIAAGSYLYLLGTGLAFWSPWLFWLAAVFGGGQISRMLHPWVGLVFVAAVCYMFGMWAPQMRFTEVDKEWWKSLHFYITNQDDKMPPAGRYNAGQKALFWSFFFGGCFCSCLDWSSGLPNRFHGVCVGFGTPRS